MATDHDIINRFSMVLMEVLDEIIAPVTNAKSEIEVDHYTNFLADFLSDKSFDSQADKIGTLIHERYGVPKELVLRNLYAPLVTIGMMCIEYRNIRDLRCIRV